MLLIFKIVILCVFAIHCYECQREYQVHFHIHIDVCENEPYRPQYVLAKKADGQTIEGNFFFAYEYCRSVGLKLPTPNTREKNEALVEFIKEIGSIWTSGNDLSKHGRFVWMVDGTLLTYTDWDENQPDHGGGTERCLEIRKDMNFKWNNLPCHFEFPVVCEIGKREAIKC